MWNEECGIVGTGETGEILRFSEFRISHFEFLISDERSLF